MTDEHRLKWLASLKADDTVIVRDGISNRRYYIKTVERTTHGFIVVDGTYYSRTTGEYISTQIGMSVWLTLEEVTEEAVDTALRWKCLDTINNINKPYSMLRWSDLSTEDLCTIYNIVQAKIKENRELAAAQLQKERESREWHEL